MNAQTQEKLNIFLLGFIIIFSILLIGITG